MQLLRGWEIDPWMSDGQMNSKNLVVNLQVYKTATLQEWTGHQSYTVQPLLLLLDKVVRMAAIG